LSFGLVTSIVAIDALDALDALNATAVFGCAYLPSTPKPLRKAVAYIAGILAVYYSLGAVLLVGFDFQANRVIDAMRSGGVRAATQVAIGCGLLVIAFRRWRRAPGALPCVDHRLRSRTSCIDADVLPLLRIAILQRRGLQILAIPAL
jgi:Sap, sulfolipid-1-addressing protein